MLAHNAASDKTVFQDVSSLLDQDMQQVNRLILAHMDSSVPLVKTVAAYLIAAGGKRIRPLLTLGFSALCGETSANSHALAAAVEFIHTATLLHDDVVDKSDQRRGKPSANASFGNQAPVLVGDFLFSRAFQLMVSTGNLEALRILSDASAVIAEGEVLQLSILGKLDIPLETYFKVLECKTAVLFAAACECGALVAGADKNQQQAAYAFGLNLGLCFQITDDLIDYSGKKEDLGKNPGDDFMEGKITLPLFLGYQSASQDDKTALSALLKKTDRNNQDFEATRAIINACNGFEKTLDFARKYHDNALKNIGIFRDSPIKSALLNLLDFTLNRKY